MASTNQKDDGNRHEQQVNKRKSVKRIAISEANVDGSTRTTII